MSGFLNDVIAETIPEKEIPLPVIEGDIDKGGTFKNISVQNPLAPSEYKDAFAMIWDITHFDPEDYDLSGVGFKAYQVAMKQKDKETGAITPVITTLYSYSGKFVRKSPFDVETEETLERMAERLRKRRMTTRRTLGIGLGEPCVETPLFADWQLGKPEIRKGDPGNTGMEQTQLRVERAIDELQKRFKLHRKFGKNVQGFALGFLGDAIDHVANSYDSQKFGAENNLVRQILFAADLMTMICEELLPMGEVQQIFAALCNHGQMARIATKTNVTNDDDNAQNLLLEMLKRILGNKFPDLEWHIPGERMIVPLEISGVQVAAAHGHKITGSEENWLSHQTNALRDDYGVAPRLWLTGHRHSQNVVDLGPYHRIQAATADGGSKFFKDATGKSSTPGTTTLLIGNHNERGFSDLELL